MKTNNIISYQFRRSGQNFWEDMADKGDWRFLEQFYPNYDSSDDIAFSDDLSCVLDENHDYKDLEWFHHSYPEFNGCSLDHIEKIRKHWDKELFQGAESNLRDLIQLRYIEVREFPTNIVSARIFGDGNEDCVVLQCADVTSSKYGAKIKVPSSELQNVLTRDLPYYDSEANDDWEIQIYYVNKASGEEYWCNAINIDFE